MDMAMLRLFARESQALNAGGHPSCVRHELAEGQPDRVLRHNPATALSSFCGYARRRFPNRYCASVAGSQTNGRPPGYRVRSAAYWFEDNCNRAARHSAPPEDLVD